ncbi:MAG TPA: thioesterase [Candidatus Limiplasma sp.]|nr:thioesterase [Candidatus Limiplasma sp.]
MEPVSIYRTKHRVELSDVDFMKKLRMSILFEYFQDISSMHAENLGVGIDTLEKEHGLAWILMRMRVEIIRTPVWDEEITLETWPQEPRIFCERDYYVRDADGNIIIRAAAIWAVFDMKARKLSREKIVYEGLPSIVKERAIQTKARKSSPLGQLEPAYTKVVGYSDVDMNGHLNNSRYIDFIMDCFSLESHQRYDVKAIEVDYLNEALPGDSLLLYKDISALDANAVYIEGVREKDKKTSFKARLVIQANETQTTL